MTKEDVIKYIEEMTVLELAELVKELESRFGVTAAPMAMGIAAGASAGAAAAPAEEERVEFDIFLTGFAADKKIQVIKAVREVTNLGLKEAKDLVEGVPQAVKEKIAKADADKIKQKLEEAGGTTEIK
ncbi:MAG: 50S ribosomal protein L7/L12 [Deltaproteobacteria bacterium RBG_16_54_18]|nr:MAG: 50S ribosomal protein L7/L12 [Deltaproteobacteria bacterium RBG_16_54_18]